MARAQKSQTTAPEDAAGLLLEIERLRLECTGLRHDNTVVTRERDGLLQENIAIRKGEHTRPRAADLRQRLDASERQLRFAQLQILSLETHCSILRETICRAATMVPKREIARQLRDLLQLCHPDKWQNATVATELTKQVNALRAAYME